MNVSGQVVIGKMRRVSEAGRSVRSAIAAVLAGAIPLLLSAAPATAATSLQPLLSASYDYSDNRNLAEGPEIKEESGGAKASVGVDWRTFNERGELSIRPQALFSSYGGDTDEDTDDQFLYVRGRHRWQTTEFSMAANYEREATLTDFDSIDFADPGAEPADEVDTGLVTKRGRRETLLAAPEFSWNVSPKTELGLGFSHLSVAYSEVPDSRRSDFDNNEADLSLEYASTERTTLGLSLAAGKYSADEDDFETDYQTAELLYRMSVSEISQVELIGGVQRAESSANGIDLDDETTDPFFGVRWNYLTEQNRWQFYAGRSIDPSGTGTRSQRDQIRFNLTRQLSARLSLLAGARWVMSEANVEGVTLNERDYGRAQLGMRWQQTRTLSFGATANYTTQDFAAETGDATAVGGVIEIIYRGLGAPR